MTKYSKQWLQPVTTEFAEALQNVRAQAVRVGNQQDFNLADNYLSVLHGRTPHLSQWLAEPSMTSNFTRAAADVSNFYRQRDIHSALGQSYKILSALPGDPHMTPRVLEPPFGLYGPHGTGDDRDESPK